MQLKIVSFSSWRFYAMIANNDGSQQKPYDNLQLH